MAIPTDPSARTRRVWAPAGTKSERYIFNLFDAKMRVIGLTVRHHECTHVANDALDGRSFYRIPEGHYYGYNHQPMRSGIEYGASQKWVWFTSAAERDAASTKAIDATRKRYMKLFG